MIFFAWSDTIPADQADDLAQLVADAVKYDAEAGFSTADPLRKAADGSTLHHLLVSMPPKGSRGSPDLDRLPDVDVVAYLRLEVVDGIGEAAFVVRPEFRSLGVATLLMERLLAEPEGWAAVDGLRVVQAWSHSAHPAAERMSWRFEAEAVQEIHKTLRLIGGRSPYEPPSAVEVTRDAVDGIGELVPFHDLGIAPADRAARDRVDVRLHVGDHDVVVGRGVDGQIEQPALVEPAWSGTPTEEQVHRVLEAGLVEAQSTGARVASLYVDVRDELLLHVSREIEFFHDQTDRLYRVALASAL